MPRQVYYALTFMEAPSVMTGNRVLSNGIFRGAPCPRFYIALWAVATGISSDPGHFLWLAADYYATASKTVRQGQSASFTVCAAEKFPIAYQWRNEGVSILRGNEQPSLFNRGGANERCVAVFRRVTNGYSRVTSSWRRLVVFDRAAAFSLNNSIFVVGNMSSPVLVRSTTFLTTTVASARTF